MQRLFKLVLNMLAIWLPLAVFVTCFVMGLASGSTHLIIVGLIGSAVALGMWGVLRMIERNKATPVRRGGGPTPPGAV